MEHFKAVFVKRDGDFDARYTTTYCLDARGLDGAKAEALRIMPRPLNSNIIQILCEDKVVGEIAFAV